jgi:hypothetical protein
MASGCILRVCYVSFFSAHLAISAATDADYSAYKEATFSQDNALITADSITPWTTSFTVITLVENVICTSEPKILQITVF